MLSVRTMVLAAIFLIGYFYFLSSGHKDRLLNSLGKLTEVEGTVRPEPPVVTATPPVPAPVPVPATPTLPEPGLSPRFRDELWRPPVPKEQLQKYLTNSFFQQDRGTFQVLRLRAIPRYSYTSQMGPIVDERMNMVFFDPTMASLPPTFPVVMNSSTGRLGVITGTIVVKLKNIRQAGILAQRFGLALKAQDDSLGLAYLVPPRVDQVAAYIYELSKYPGVKYVKAEIFQSWKMSHVEKFDGAVPVISK